MIGQLEEEKMQVCVQLGIRLLYKVQIVDIKTMEFDKGGNVMGRFWVIVLDTLLYGERFQKLTG
jgi:hypothetical protein